MAISALHEVDTLPAVTAELGYIAPDVDRAEVLVYPASSGLEAVRPEPYPVATTVYDLRPAAESSSLDDTGFEFHTHDTSFGDYYDEHRVRDNYYPETRQVLLDLLPVEEVIVFDHNVRSSVRAARGERGVREPVDQAHNDYTEESGPLRMQDILADAGRSDLADRHFALVNLWRPIIGPVVDTPLALCAAASVAPDDLVITDIHHFADGDIETPAHSGQIYSLRAAPAQRWFYASSMQPDEVLLLKCYDSRRDGRARFMPHTGFRHPDCPAEYTPRESIEARTLVVFDSKR